MKNLPRWALWTTLALFVLLVILNVVTLVLLVGRLPASAGVRLTILAAPDCPTCTDAATYQSELETIGVAFGEVKVYQPDSFAGKRLISKYGITKAPALIFSKELGAYEEIAAAWSRIGTVADDGSYVLQGALPPYYDLDEERVRGLVTLIYLGDTSCSDCYDVTIHKQILERFGMAFDTISTVDVSSAEGKELLQRYAITKVPTALVQGDADVYLGFADVWESVGTVENDGTYVFRSVELVGEPYKDLTTGQVVTPTE